MNHRRRKILTSSAMLALSPALFAEELLKTPRMTAGPFYPDKLPLDKDNDLIIVNDSTTPAIGQVLLLSGQVMDTNGRMVKDALVEIWQVDANGRYLHSRDYDQDENDKNFQGYGAFQTDGNGAYRFRTIRPVEYGSGFARRTPHIHIAITSPQHKPLVSQIFFADEDNSDDGLWSRLSKPQRQALSVLPQPLAGSNINEQTATFNVVLG